jgi:hypothetical protein
MLSGSFLPGEVQRAYDLGANSFLHKPTVHAHLVELMVDLKNYWLRRNRFALMEEPK